MQKKLNMIIVTAMMLFIISCSKDDSNPVEPEKKPTISSLSSDSVCIGDLITIYGTNFGTVRDSSIVSFSGINAKIYKSWSDTAIKVEVPNGAKSGKLWVVVNGEKSNEVDFTNKSEVEMESVKIGNQIWMTKNLDVNHYRNGDPIRHAQTTDEWEDANNKREGACCYYNNDPAKGAIYGKLYNWYAVNDPRGLAPNGWHIPTNAEWIILENCLGSSSVAGGKMKSTGTKEGGDGLWRRPNEGATNESGFSALPGGSRDYYGSFSSIEYLCSWWSATESTETYAFFETLHYFYNFVGRGGSEKEYGFSVRCVTD